MISILQAALALALAVSVASPAVPLAVNVDVGRKVRYWMGWTSRGFDAADRALSTVLAILSCRSFVDLDK